MKINAKDFRVQEGKAVKLKKWPTQVKPVYKSKERYQELLREHAEELSSLQRLHYASNRYAVLLIFQAMDAAGKDGAIRHVMSGVNPQGLLNPAFRGQTDTKCRIQQQLEFEKSGKWWARQDSNLRPRDYESPALTN
jgi:polyphosphate kinase 2 (PPK2 family)